MIFSTTDSHVEWCGWSSLMPQQDVQALSPGHGQSKRKSNARHKPFCENSDTGHGTRHTEFMCNVRTPQPR